MVVAFFTDTNVDNSYIAYCKKDNSIYDINYLIKSNTYERAIFNNFMSYMNYIINNCISRHANYKNCSKRPK